jgi:hypothetical protein
MKRERIKRQINESLLLGVMEYIRCKTANLGYCISKENVKDSELLESTRNNLNDPILDQLYLYSYLIDSLKSKFYDEEWKTLTKSGRKFSLFLNKPSLIDGSIWKSDIGDDPLHILCMTIVLVSLYRDESTKNRAIAMLETVPLKLKETVLTVVGHSKFKDIIKTYE